MHIAFFLPILIAILTLTGCDSKKSPSSPQCDVLVSIPPYLYFVNQLTNGELKAESLVPVGANPHLYEPSPRQVAEAREAKVWIRLSEGFEQKILLSLQEKNPELIVVNLAEDLTLPPLPSNSGSCKCCHHKESLDLHFWLSLRLAKDQAIFIAKALCQAFPERTGQIESNLALLEKKFEDTDLLITQELSPYEGQAILVSHPAFGYFCCDYKLKQISIEQEGKDPLPKEISAILHSAQSSSIRTVLTQAQYNNKGALLIAESLKLPVHEVDPYSENYLDNLLYIAHCIDKP
ncbi:MAG: zinc ABC transporter substrate-binding protein [Chlamydiota bacterium]